MSYAFTMVVVIVGGWCREQHVLWTKKITTGNYYNELQLNTMYGKGKLGRQNMKTGDV